MPSKHFATDLHSQSKFPVASWFNFGRPHVPTSLFLLGFFFWLLEVFELFFNNPLNFIGICFNFPIFISNLLIWDFIFPSVGLARAYQSSIWVWKQEWSSNEGGTLSTGLVSGSCSTKFFCHPEPSARGGTAHSGLGPPTSINHQKRLHRHAHRCLLGATLSSNLRLPQVTLTYLKVTAHTNQLSGIVCTWCQRTERGGLREESLNLNTQAQRGQNLKERRDRAQANQN